MADNYVGYAYNNNLTKGMSEDKFGVSNATSQMYLTFVLRSLGYDDTNQKDFSYSDPYTLARSIGILTDRVDINEFLRADAVIVSYASLDTKLNGVDANLYEKLISSNAFTEAEFKQYYKHSLNTVAVKPQEVISQPVSTGVSNNALNAKEISDKCSSAVFHIDTYGLNGAERATGSGFFISADGWAITNYHVATNTSYMKISTTDGKVYTDVKISNTDKDNDIALLKISGGTFNYIELGDSDKISQGQFVYAIGNPLGLTNTLSQGIISNVSRNLDGINYIQISVPIDHGSSGGVLLDETGKAIGITTAGKNSSADLNFAVPINHVKKIQKDENADLLLWTDNYYQGFSKAIDFGDFSNARLLYTEKVSSGYNLYYDIKDFHDNFDVPAMQYMSYAMLIYKDALLGRGFSFTYPLNDDLVNGVYTNYDVNEMVSIEVDFQKETILIAPWHIPTMYLELGQQIPDFGAFTGIPGEKVTSTDARLFYKYRWVGVCDYDTLISKIADYMDVLTKVFGFVYVPGTNQSQFSFTDGNVSFSIFIDDSNYVSVVGM